MSEGLNYLLSFMPVGTSAEVLEKTLVGRKNLVDRLEELVIESAKSGNKHQRLIIGPKGSGKTHTLRVLHDRVYTNTKLKDKLAIAYLIEEEYGVATFLDWIIRILRAFIRWDSKEAGYLEAEIEKLKETPPDDRERIAAQVLLNHIEGKTLLIIVENIENIFDDKKGFGKTGQAKLRDLIQQNPVFTIMASNQALFRDIQYEDRPFYNFFRIIHLDRLSLEDTIIFLKSIAEADENRELIEFLNSRNGKNRIMAIYDLLGGNHRLLVIFYNYLKTEYYNKLSASFMKTINDLIPFYQGMMDQLSSQQQKIVQHLCRVRGAVTGKDISRDCFIDPNTLSKQMSNLVRLKYVDSIPRGRETFYELAEPVLRICFEVKENRGGPVKRFIDFLGDMYTAKEIETERQPKNEALFVKEPSVKYGTQKKDKSWSDNLTTLLINSPHENISNYLKKVMKKGLSEQLLKAIPQAIFEILIQHQTIETKRFEFIETILKETFKENESMIVPLKFLDIGIRHLKKNEKNVLFRFTKEERQTFKKFVLDKIT